MKPRHLLIAAIVSVLPVFAACGNKGPLVRPSDVPPPIGAAPAEAAPAEVAPAVEPAPDAVDGALPDTTPPAEPPVTDTAAPAPAQDDGG